VGVGGQRALQGHGEVQARLVGPAVVEIMPRLMPPTKATSSRSPRSSPASAPSGTSQTHSFWCSRRSCPGCSQDHQRSSGRNTSSCTALPANRLRTAGSDLMLPKPSTTTRTATPRAAAAMSASATERAAGSS
jgi:hypothetical protein